MSDLASQTAPQDILTPIATEAPKEETKEIKLSPYTKALLDAVQSIKQKATPDDLSKLTVSQTVSFLAIAYEKVRNAVEYREDHLVLRAAIERILKRRLALNPEGKSEAENLLRELTWARYFPNESLGDHDIQAVQKIIDQYIEIRSRILSGKDSKEQVYLAQFLFEMLTCEIEETLNPEDTQRIASYTFFIFQTIREKIKVEGVEPDKKDAFLLVALDKSFRKSDLPYRRYHLFTTFYRPLSHLTGEEKEKLIPNLSIVFKRIDEMITDPQVDHINKFVRKQLPPFLVLFDILNEKKKQALEILTDSATLWREVEHTCNEKYKQVGARLRSLAFRSLIYIFTTKMLIALALEYPVSMYFYNEVHTTSIIINTVFPPLLMLFIVLFFKLPGADNTKKIYDRIVNIIDADKTFETQVALIRKRDTSQKTLKVFIFTILYSLTFLVTLFLIRQILIMLGFNIISQALFIFFISVVSFFSYRIKQVINEYKLGDKEGILSPIIDFFFLPVLSLGKFFSREIAKINLFIVIFDFIIEAPFKLIIEVFEDWIKFVRARKKDIV